MKEKIAIRVEEVKAWGELAECLDHMTVDAEEALESAQESFEKCYLGVGEVAETSREYKNVQKCKAVLAAYDCVRAAILKAIG